MARWPSTLRARLTLWYTALLGVPLIALALGFYLLFARILQSRTDQFINDALTAFSRELVAERRAALTPSAAIHTTVNEVRFQDLRIAILDSTGRVVAMSPDAESEEDHDRADEGRPPDALGQQVSDAMRRRTLTQPVSVTVTTARSDYLVQSRPFTIDNLPFVLTGAYSLRDTEEVLDRVREILGLAVPLLLLGAITGGYFLATRNLVPLSAMAARAAEISAANLQDRLPVAGGEELAGLARVVNGLLDRLEASFAQQQRFMADASHELRTPAAIVRTEADVTLAQPRRPESDYRESLAVVQGAARRMTRIVDDLLLLARADAGVAVEHREHVYLEEIVHDVARDVRLLAESRHVRVEVGSVVDAPIYADADLVGRLVLNLLDNAIKHSPEGSTVRIEMARTATACDVRIVDAGSGIPADVQSRVFERFFRADAARSTGEPRPAGDLDAPAVGGAGLGLAIAGRIAELHAGRLELVESRPGRTEFRLTLPLDPAAVGAG
jgi:two-component system, OmpR family, sensor kinase